MGHYKTLGFHSTHNRGNYHGGSQKGIGGLEAHRWRGRRVLEKQTWKMELECALGTPQVEAQEPKTELLLEPGLRGHSKEDHSL